jgi:predicted metal-dependent hydrolase
VNEEKIKEKLFQDGLGHYSANDYFEAHESWEDLWSDHYLEDRKFVQGLIQLSVSFVHLENGNMTGAKNLLRKSKEKFKLFSEIQRGIKIKLLLDQIETIGVTYDNLESPTDFDWTLVPTLE